MALLRLVTLCTVLSTALSFVAMAPPTGSKPLAAARAPAATAAAWGVQQRRGRVASALNAGACVCMAIVGLGVDWAGWLVGDWIRGRPSLTWRVGMYVDVRVCVL